MTGDLRIAGHRGRPLQILVDGVAVAAFEGETVAGALLAAGLAAARHTPGMRTPRGYFCGMGVCWDCAMVVNGTPNTRTCRTLVEAGMRIATQRGDGPEPDL